MLRPLAIALILGAFSVLLSPLSSAGDVKLRFHGNKVHSGHHYHEKHQGRRHHRAPRSDSRHYRPHRQKHSRHYKKPPQRHGNGHANVSHYHMDYGLAYPRQGHAKPGHLRCIKDGHRTICTSSKAWQTSR